MLRRQVLRAFPIAVLLLCGNSALAAPDAELWPRWQEHDATSTRSVDHRAWNELLMRHVSRGTDRVNRFDYGAVSAAGRAELAQYLDSLARAPISEFNRREQMAYWINLYNALTVKVILDHWPVVSIRDIDISPGLFASGPWGKKLISVEGERLALDDIEHRILRPIWRDPRIHYAVNCASIGCPDLRGGAFSAATLDEDLDAAARDFINHPRAVMVQGGELNVSSIYDWFKADFGGDDAGVIAHLRKYAAPALAAQLEALRTVGDYRYDWSLNQP